MFMFSDAKLSGFFIIGVLLVRSVAASPDSAYDTGLRKLEDEFQQTAASARSLRDERRAKAGAIASSFSARAVNPIVAKLKHVKYFWHSS